MHVPFHDQEPMPKELRARLTVEEYQQKELEKKSLQESHLWRLLFSFFAAAAVGIALYVGCYFLQRKLWLTFPRQTSDAVWITLLITQWIGTLLATCFSICTMFTFCRIIITMWSNRR